MQTLYPAIKTYAEHNLAVDPPHELYIAECGNPDGLPVLILHSGPGAGCESYHRRLFDPEVYRMILVDQRGAGRSTPHICLEKNTTADLINDIESIRKHLDIPRWLLFGDAWGATLAILYAQQYPQTALGMILRSTFLARHTDIEWFYEQGANLVFPDYWQDFVQILPEEERDKPLKGYYERLSGQDEVARMAFAKAWSLWQARCKTLQPHMHLINQYSDPHVATSLATLEAHYFTHNCFIDDNQILNNVDAITHIPCALIHGRYNIVCPLGGIWELHQHWSNSELYIIRDAGHAAREPGIIDATILATKKMASPENRLR